MFGYTFLRFKVFHTLGKKEHEMQSTTEGFIEAYKEIVKH